jgi:DNA processing protein
MAALLRRRGAVVLDRLLADMRPHELAALERQAESLHARRVRAVLIGDEGYPASLAWSPDAPPALFHRGPVELLGRPAVAICGANEADDGALVAAEAAARLAVDAGMVVVTGDPVGVAGAALRAAVEHGGRAAVVLPEGIRRIRLGEPAVDVGSGRVVVLSQFPPEQPWSVGGAMARNATMAALCTAMVAVAPGSTGVTLDAGQRALGAGKPVLTVGDTHGSRLLVDRGATPARDRIELSWWFDRLVARAPRPAEEPRSAELRTHRRIRSHAAWRPVVQAR